jgi:hypothetical protein
MFTVKLLKATSERFAAQMVPIVISSKTLVVSSVVQVQDPSVAGATKNVTAKATVEGHPVPVNTDSTEANGTSNTTQDEDAAFSTEFGRAGGSSVSRTMLVGSLTVQFSQVANLLPFLASKQVLLQCLSSFFSVFRYFEDRDYRCRGSCSWPSSDANTAKCIWRGQ